VNNGATEAARLANTGRKQSTAWKKKRAAAKCRKVVINGVIYDSGKAAALALGVSRAAISGWTKDGRAIKLER
jgi:hypothetical protein